MSVWRQVLAVLACTTALSVSAAPDAKILVERLGREAPSRIAFTEARFSTLLRQPLVVSGELGYLGAGDLDRSVTRPYRETTTIRGNTVRIEREGQEVRSFALERAPELEGFLSAFGALLGGDVGVLERHFAIAANGDEAGDWTLELTPLEERARRRVSRIAIYGRAAELRCLATVDAKRTGSVVLLGDHSTTTILPESSIDDLIARCRER